MTYGDEDFPAARPGRLSVRGSPGPGRRAVGRDRSTWAPQARAGEGVRVGPSLRGGNVAWFGRETFFGLKLKAIHRSTTVGVEWHVAAGFSLDRPVPGVTSGAAERLADFSLPCHEIVAGFKWEPRRGCSSGGDRKAHRQFNNSPASGSCPGSRSGGERATYREPASVGGLPFAFLPGLGVVVGVLERAELPQACLKDLELGPRVLPLLPCRA